jgi:hypothetical protein
VIHNYLGDNVVAFQQKIKGIASPGENTSAIDATHCMNRHVILTSNNLDQIIEDVLISLDDRFHGIWMSSCCMFWKG